MDDAPAEPNPRRHRRSWWFVASVLALTVLVITTAVLTFARAFSPREVTYEVTGSAESISMNYSTSDDSIAYSGVELSSNVYNGAFRITVSANRGEDLQLSASNDGQSGSVTCTIEVNGDVVATGSAIAPETAVMCRGTA